VVVETADKVGRKSFDQTKFELNIKAPAAAPAPATMTEQTIPTIAVFSGDQSPSAITGTWDEAHAKSLKISIPGADLSASLGTDAALSSTQGAWTLALSQGLSPGIYNVIAESTDAAGKTVADQTTAEIYIKTPPPPLPPPPPPPPYDCAGVLAKISAIFPLRFEFDSTQLKPPPDVAVNQYAALLKDPRCATVRAEIAGHSDFFGPRLYNQALSEWRARTVVNALVAAGVEASRLSTKGFSESVPVDSKKSIAARKKNRRVEITLVK
jgi:outer membrane protein OmpA-like peptidoglycan-associated protein